MINRCYSPCMAHSSMDPPTEHDAPSSNGNDHPIDHVSLTPAPLNAPDLWNLGGTKVPKSEIVYFCQMTVIFTVIIACIVNISLGHNSDIWLVLLSTSLGCAMPAPRIKSTVKIRGNL